MAAKQEPFVDVSPSRAASLLALIDQATADDLAEIDGEIKTVETRLDGLRSARKLLASRLGVEEPAKKKFTRQTAATSGSATSNGMATDSPRAAAVMSGAPTSSIDSTNQNDPVAVRILDHIAKCGPKTSSQLVKELSVNYQTAYAAIGKDWFDRQANGVHLSASGWAMAKERMRKTGEKNGTADDDDDD